MSERYLPCAIPITDAQITTIEGNLEGSEQVFVTKETVRALIARVRLEMQRKDNFKDNLFLAQETIDNLARDKGEKHNKE